MAWVYLDDHFPDHPKVAAAGGDAAWLFVCGLAYIKRYATPGTIPTAQVARLTDRRTPSRLAAKLVAVGLWHDRGDHYEVHDYHEWNKPQESRTVAARKAAKARWSKATDHALGNANAYADASESQSERNADAYASTCPPPHTPTVETNPSSDLRGGAVDNSAGQGLVDQAVALAAKRYGESQVANGSGGKSATALARWWLEHFATDAHDQAKALLAEYDLGKTQLADALLDPNPPWLRHYRRWETAT